MGTESMYFLSPDGDKLIEYSSGKQLPLSQFTDVPIGISPPTGGMIANRQALMHQNARYAKASIHDTIDRKRINILELSKDKMNELTNEVSEFTGYKNTTEISKAIKAQNDMITKTILGIDMETAYSRLDSSLYSKMTYSVGLSKVVESSLFLGENGTKFGVEALRLRNHISKEYVDIDIFKDQMDRLIDPTYKNNKYDNIAFGKRNTAYYIDVLKENKIKRLETTLPNLTSGSKAYQNANKELNKLRTTPSAVEQLIDSNDAFISPTEMNLLKTQAAMVEDEYRHTIKLAEKTMQSEQQYEYKPGKFGYKVSREYNLGIFEGVSGEQRLLKKGKVGSKLQLILSQDPRVSAATNDLSTNKQWYNSFSSMEHNQLAFNIQVLQEAEFTGKLGNISLSNNQIDSLSHVISKAKRAERNIKDVAPLTKVYLDSFLPDMYNIHTQSKSVIQDALTHIGVEDHIIKDTLSTLSTKFNDNYLKGYNVEFLLGAVKDVKNYQEYHIGHADSIDLSSSILYLDNLNESMEISASGHDPKLLTTGRTAYLMKRAPVDLVNVSQRIITELHKTQVTSHLVKSHTNNYSNKIFRKAGMSTEYANLLSKNLNHDQFNKELTGLYSRVVNNSIDQEINILKNTGGGVNRFATTDHELLSKVINGRNLGRVLALSFASAIDGFISSDTSQIDDHGQHSGMERSLQRLVGSDFGSAVNLRTVGKFVFNQVKRWNGRGKEMSSSLMRWGRKALKGGTTEEANATLLANRPEYSVAWKSHIARLDNKASNFVKNIEQESLASSRSGYKVISQEEQEIIKSRFHQPGIVESLPKSNKFNIYSENEAIEFSNTMNIKDPRMIPRTNNTLSAYSKEEYFAKYPAGQRLEINTKKPNTLANYVMSNGIGEHTILNRIAKRGISNSKHAQITQIHFNDKIAKRMDQDIIPFRFPIQDLKHNNAPPVLKYIRKESKLITDNSIGNASRVKVPRGSKILPHHKHKPIGNSIFKLKRTKELNNKILPMPKQSTITENRAIINKTNNLPSIVQGNTVVAEKNIPIAQITSTPKVKYTSPMTLIKQNKYHDTVVEMQKSNSLFSGAGLNISKLALNAM